jgi:hypothetical protein
MNSLATAYPYPVLRDWMDDYKGSMFTLEVSELSRADDNILIPYKITLENAFLVDQIIDHKATLAFELVCKSTLVHKFAPLESMEGEYVIESWMIAGQFQLQAFVVSTTSQSDYEPSPINAEYKDKIFEVQAGDTLAESHVVDLAIDFNRKSSGDSIEVRHVEGMGPYEYEIDTSGNFIVISTGEKAHYYYLALQGDGSTKAHLYQSLYKDAVLVGIETLIDDPDSHERAWARGLLLKMKSLNLDLPHTKEVSQLNKLALEIIGPDGMGKVRSNVN